MRGEIIIILIHSITAITLGITNSSVRSAVSNITLAGGRVAVALGPNLKKHHLNIPDPFNLFIFLFSSFFYSCPHFFCFLVLN